MQLLLLYVGSLKLFIFSLISSYLYSAWPDLIYIHSHLTYIQSHLIYFLPHLICVQSHLVHIQSDLICIKSYLIYIQSHVILFSLLFAFSLTYCARDMVPQILPCSRSRYNQIELRKYQIQRYKNSENRILHSNKNIVETLEALEELHSL